MSTNNVLKTAHLVFTIDEATEILEDANALTPAARVAAVQRFRIAQTRAADATKQYDELVKRARRAATAESDEAEAIRVIKTVTGNLDKYEAAFEKVAGENAILKTALSEWHAKFKEVGTDLNELIAVVKTEVAETRKAVHDLGKTAAVASPLRAPASGAARDSAGGVAALEKALASTTHPETINHLTRQIALLKSR